MKLDGSSGPENNGVRKDHTTIKEKSAAPIFMALRAACVFTTPVHRRFARTPLRLLALAINTCLDQDLQLLREIDREQPLLLGLVAVVHASPVRVRQ
jgi:hypothetical protein